jgi:hypothetical protein
LTDELLSYAIPQQFGQQRLDSRLCAEITNININVAHVIDLFGMGKFANPLTAHTGYDSDDRVVALIANGIVHTLLIANTFYYSLYQCSLSQHIKQCIFD